MDNSIKIRSTKHYDKDIFTELLTKVDWSKLYLCRNVNKAWGIFKDLFLSTLDEVAPIREIKVKKKTEPWITSEILELISERDQYFSIFKRSGCDQDYSNYCKLRNKVQRMINSVKSCYFENKIEENKNNPKKLWEQFRNLGYSNKQKDTSKIVLNIENSSCHDSRTFANHFNNFFTTVAEKLVVKLPSAKGF